MVKKSRWKFFFAIIALLVLLTLDGFGRAAFLKGPVLTVTGPVVKFAGYLGSRAKAPFFWLFELRNLIVNQQRLINENKFLSSENAGLKLVKEENSQLRELLGIRQKLPRITVAASVISRDPTGISDLVTINRGRNDGISKGDVILDSNGGLIGIVREVFEEVSNFYLITDGSTKIDTAVPGKGGLGLITGSHSLGLNFQLLTPGIVLEEGDSLVTSGLSGNFPSGIIVGKVGQKLSTEAELFQIFSVNPTSDFSHQRFVLVVSDF